MRRIPSVSSFATVAATAAQEFIEKSKKRIVLNERPSYPVHIVPHRFGKLPQWPRLPQHNHSAHPRVFRVVAILPRRAAALQAIGRTILNASQQPAIKIEKKFLSVMFFARRLLPNKGNAVSEWPLFANKTINNSVANSEPDPCRCIY